MGKHFGTYPADWPEISRRIKAAAGWRCERCGHPDEPPFKLEGALLVHRVNEWAKQRYGIEWFDREIMLRGEIRIPIGPAACDERCSHPQDGKQRMLTVHHLDLNKSNVEDWNLASLCQGCHLSVQGRVDMSRDYMLDHSSWMIPHVEGRDAAIAAGTWPVGPTTTVSHTVEPSEHPDRAVFTGWPPARIG